MSKLLRGKDWVLFSAAFAGEIISEFKNVGGLVPGLLEYRYGKVPPNLKKESYSSYMSKLLSVGEIAKLHDKKGNSYLELTSTGREKIKRKFPLFMKGKWDGKFMTVIFDMKEEDKGARNMLRSKLKELGFGMLQESVWISPYHFEEDLNDYLSEKGYFEFVYIMKVNMILGKRIRENASKIWNLNHIDKAYKTVIEKAKSMKEGSGGKEDLIEIWNNYLRVLRNDPLLPDELLPKNWLQKNALEAVTELFRHDNKHAIA